MIIDKEEDRGLLRMAVANIPISGPAGAPEILQHVNAVHRLLASIDGAQVDAMRATSLDMLEGRG
jgi:hypothetical protein